MSLACGNSPPVSQEREELYHVPHMGMWTKLRPGVREFLASCAPLFEMSIYTHGDREYAGQMARFLDPTGGLFAARIISQVSHAPVLLLCHGGGYHARTHRASRQRCSVPRCAIIARLAFWTVDGCSFKATDAVFWGGAALVRRLLP